MTDRFYNSRAWKLLRRQKLIDAPLCEKCGGVATDVDHIKAINNGGDPMDWDNLQSLCHGCHSQKTMYIEKLGRDRIPVNGCKASGAPLDPAHWWNGH